MNHSKILPIFLSLGIFITAGCNKSETPATEVSEATVATVTQSAASPNHGAWLGEGTFRAQQGTQQVKAQLELLAGGTYRFMVIEPRVLMMVVGLEKGNWQRTDELLNLNPFPDQSNSNGGVFNKAPKNFRPKSLTIDGDTFLLQDDQMNLRFTPNPKATEKLAKRGEI